MKNKLLLCISHSGFAAAGFAAGIYLLPILTAPDAPTVNQVTDLSGQALYQGEFTRELSGSDFLHWGEGKVFVGRNFIALEGKVAPGPDYKLYLSPVFVENEMQFEQEKNQMTVAGDVKTFTNFIVHFSPDIDPGAYNTVIVWCESFGEFISAARYR